MARIRFDLIGEGRPLISVARFLASSSNAEIGTIASSDLDEGALSEILGKPPLSAHDFVSAPQTTAQWLINMNSAMILPSALLDLYGGRALNLHNGPLPAYAGRHVTQWGIRNGETEFAATVHFMALGVDKGDVVAERRFPIRKTDTGLSLLITSFKEGQKLMKEVLGLLLAGESLPKRPQDLSRRRNYRHSDALDSRVPWSCGAQMVVDFLRAGDYRPLTSPSYTATASLPDGAEILLYRALPVNGAAGVPGNILRVTPEGPVVACGGDGIIITDAAIGDKKLDATLWEDLIAPFSRPILSGRPAHV